MKNYVYLKMIDVKNNNYKFYEITENDDHSLDVKYGRVGAEHVTNQHYNAYDKWNFYSLRDSKVKKGYVEDTSHKAVVDNTNNKAVQTAATYQPIEYAPVREVVMEFLRKQKQYFNQNYSVKIESVTEKQIDDAKYYLNELRKVRNNQHDNPTKNMVTEFNNVLYKEDGWTGKALPECLLFCVERKIRQVSDALMNDKYGMTLSVNDYKSVMHEMDNIIRREDTLITALEGEYKRYKTAHPDVDKKTKPTKDETILSANGLKMDEITYKEEDVIWDLLRKENFQGMENLSRYNSAYKVEVERTQGKYDEYCKKNNIKDKMLLWHGSITENMWSIMTNGLKIMPHAANGRAFGNGLYFANKSQKSANYSSAKPNVKNGKTSRNWNNGQDSHGYLALFEVATGNPYIITNTYASSIRPPYNSLWYQAGKGGSFRDDEIVVYSDNACTLKYMVKIDSDPHPRHYHLNPSHCHLDNGVTELVKDKAGVYGRLDITELSDKDRNYIGRKFNFTSADDVRIYEDKITVNRKALTAYQDGTSITKDDLWYLFREVKKNFFEKESEYEKAVENVKTNDVVADKSVFEKDEYKEERG